MTLGQCLEMNKVSIVSNLSVLHNQGIFKVTDPLTVSIVSNLSVLHNPLFLYNGTCQHFNVNFSRCNSAFFVIVLQKRGLYYLLTFFLESCNESH